MEPPWEKGPERIEHLLARRGEAREILAFYQSLLVFQKSLFDALKEAGLSGSLRRDLAVLTEYFPTFLDWAADNGSTLLRSQAREIAGWERGRPDELFFSYRRGAEIPGGNFFPKAFLQAYAACLAGRGIAVADREAEAGCGCCGAAPQLSYLQSPPSVTGAGSEGAKRRLLCSLCFTEWAVNRVSCPHCREVDPKKLPYYQSEQIPTVRVEACDSCKRYLKGVDLTKDGLAVPLVDELATPALDLWAQENGYVKLELNLAGV